MAAGSRTASVVRGSTHCLGPLGLLATLLVVGACQAPPASDGGDVEPRYLFAWSGDADKADSDFLAVVDLTEGSPTFGAVVRSVPVGHAGTNAHHTEHVLSGRGTLFANGFDAGLTFVFDLRDPLSPALTASFEGAGPLRHPHSFERLASGNVLATLMNESDGHDRTGGIAEIDEAGQVVRFASGANVEADPEVRAYSLAPVPAIDRIVTTGADMWGERTSNSVQIWSLSDLILLQTLHLSTDANDGRSLFPGEPRVLQDGRTVMVVTYGCGLYLLDGLEATAASARLVYEFPSTDTPDCALAARIGEYWVQAVPAINGLMALDVSDPAHPSVASTLELGPEDLPHWIAANRDGDRLAITGFGGLMSRIVLAGFDRGSGRLTLDGDVGPDGIDFSGPDWPHGATGPALPHGTVFSW